MLLCLSCGREAKRVIYLGAPMKLCSEPECSTLFGVFSWLPVWFPITDGRGWRFMVYECSYPRALWRWLTDSDDDEDDDGGDMRAVFA